MAIGYKVLGQVKPSAATATTLYTVPTGSGNYAVVSSLVVANLGVVPTSVSVAVRPAGATLEDKHYVIFGNMISATTSETYTIGLTLGATDVVTVVDSVGGCSFNLFGSENS
jgi:hypothetical protein